MVRPIRFDSMVPCSSQLTIYIGSSNRNPIIFDIWERERFEERIFTSGMKLIGVLLLSALLVSNVAADHLTVQNLTHMDQDLEKRGLTGKGDCFDGITYYGYCYKFVSEEKTWIEAELYCQTLGPEGHLASIHCEAQNQIIRKSLPVRTPLWIGLNDIYKEGTYLWTDGSSSNFVNWATGQPDNSRGAEDCVHLTATTFNWNDLPCNSQLCFLCSYKLPSCCCN
ncbi:C-type lectin BML-2-like [Rhincodon typus]|uniref:C-type lectin BML-2-like n=1 Tax=Rhincodon typus TaxID=259920 RepID=UPI0020306CA8|nr:C-type lectin BML-2-like [Rhincodon typus]